MRSWIRPVPVLAAGALLMTPPAHAADLIETPMLRKAVAAGKLPPVAQRVPERPGIAKFDGENNRIGSPGGDLRILMARAKDTRIMVVYGYARLVGYNAELELKPDILERYEVKEGRIFTFYLRPGHRWSDGHPFTSEDFRHYWEDVANNKKLSKYGLPQALLVDGKKPKFEVIDAHTVRYTWDRPNSYFLAALCGASPLYMYRPAHYLKRFHEKYAKPKKLRKWNKKRGGWARVYLKRARQYRNENPDLPTLQPWVLKTRNRSAERFIFERNPYYHRI
ncbi:MAG: ABC transporter substrate-binding protein, partial [Pseudomonadota bacterium]